MNNEPSFKSTLKYRGVEYQTQPSPLDKIKDLEGQVTELNAMLALLLNKGNETQDKPELAKQLDKLNMGSYIAEYAEFLKNVNSQEYIKEYEFIKKSTFVELSQRYNGISNRQLLLNITLRKINDIAKASEILKAKLSFPQLLIATPSKLILDDIYRQFIVSQMPEKNDYANSLAEFIVFLKHKAGLLEPDQIV
ncbi:MAG: hypothetical protein OHK0017_03540 [Patescibacteria group bacterium]